jgi:hypothetical protein
MEQFVASSCLLPEFRDSGLASWVLRHRSAMASSPLCCLTQAIVENRAVASGRHEIAAVRVAPPSELIGSCSSQVKIGTKLGRVEAICTLP